MFPTIHSIQELSICNKSFERLNSKGHKGFRLSVGVPKPAHSSASKRKSQRRLIRQGKRS